VIWKLLLVGEQSFRPLNAPELLKEVYLDTQYVDGIKKAKREEKTKAAA
jgi:hypothetical protein